MKFSNKFLYAALMAAISFFAATPAEAKVELPPILSNHMVLQQKSVVKLWGKGNGTIDVSVSWNSKTYQTQCDKDGKWILSLETPSATYIPQSITISDKDNSVVLKDVLLGEVWLCGGQSNMEMPLDGFWACPVEGSAEAIATAGQWKDKIRRVKIPKTGHVEVQETVEGKWEVPSTETAGGISAVGWFFANMLNNVLDVPVGLVECNWGGSAVESWLPKEIVDTYPVETLANPKVLNKEPGGWWHHTSSYVMYNAMLHPVHNYAVKGFIWYQGETNAGLSQYYAERLATMVKEWRDLWGMGELPFYEVELAPWKYGGDGTSGARQREAQRKAVDLIPNSGIVTTNDLVYPYEYDQIHPCKKKEVGYRLAYQALNKTYNKKGVVCDGPVYKSMEVKGNEIVISFHGSQEGFSPWHGIVGFEVAGEDRVFHPAEARIQDVHYIVVKSDAVANPVAVRYCFRDFQIGNLVGRRNMPVAPFRSDNWK